MFRALEPMIAWMATRRVRGRFFPVSRRNYKSGRKRRNHGILWFAITFHDCLQWWSLPDYLWWCRWKRPALYSTFTGFVQNLVFMYQKLSVSIPWLISSPNRSSFGKVSVDSMLVGVFMFSLKYNWSITINSGSFSRECMVDTVVFCPSLPEIHCTYVELN